MTDHPVALVRVPVELAGTPAIRNALGLYRSAILCGEQWSDTCRDAYLAALKELDQFAMLAAAPAPSSLAGGAREVLKNAFLPYLPEPNQGASWIDYIDAVASRLAALSPEAPARELWIAATDRPDTKGDLWLAVDAAGKLYPGVFVNHRIPAEAALVQRIVLPGQDALSPRHEAPVEGAGEREIALALREARNRLHSGKVVLGDIDAIMDAVQFLEDQAALRARSSAPEARS